VPLLLALDEGTTSARAALYDETGKRLAMQSAPLASSYPFPGWVEQAAPGPIHAIGITNQRETVVVWDRRTGKAVAPAIVWQCRRTADYCRELAGHSDWIARKTGLVVDAYFSASKLKWILDREPGARDRARAGELLFGTVDSWLIWRLTDGAVHVTDESNASRTMLMNIQSGEWDRELLELFDVPEAMLPRIVPSSEVVGVTSARHFGREIPIAGIAGDQQAALAGQACFRPGLSKNTYGTGCFVLMHTGGQAPLSRNRLLGTRAASVNGDPAFAIEGSIFIAGAAVQWMRDRLRLIGTAAESEAVAQQVTDTGGVYLVPAFVGLGAPHWDASARGTLSGMTLGTTREHIVRATLESIAYQTRELIDAMRADGAPPMEELRVDGGASANGFLMQFQADILGCPIARPADTETTALGAAYLAGLATGVWSGTAELESLWARDRVFEPAMDAGRREELYAGWKEAVQRARFQQSATAVTT
jgi:glycerol kinase